MSCVSSNSSINSLKMSSVLYSKLSFLECAPAEWLSFLECEPTDWLPFLECEPTEALPFLECDADPFCYYFDLNTSEVRNINGLIEFSKS